VDYTKQHYNIYCNKKQLSQRGRAMFSVNQHFAKSLKIIQSVRNYILE